MTDESSLFKVKKYVTLPLLKMEEHDNVVHVTIKEPIFKAKETEGQRQRKDAEGNIQAPPEVMKVDFLTIVNGAVKAKPMQMVVNKVLGSELREAYPADGYVGKSFQITKIKPSGQKRYALFEVLEIELKEAPATESAKPAKK